MGKSLKEHILNHHNTSKVFRHNCENDIEQPPPTLQCNQCTRTFGSKSDLTRHIESVHYQEHFECPSCDLNFSRRDNFELHWGKKHLKTPKFCVTCGMKFENYSELQRHSEKAKCSTLKCQICQKTFSCKSALRRHKRDTCNFENKVYVMKCDLCETTFVRTSDLVKHKKNRVNPDSSSKLVCSICDKNACNRKLLMAHIKAKHGGYK